MLSRALSLATVMFLVGCLAAVPGQAQNLEAGKSPSQIFAGTCSLCHKTSRGLLKTVPAGSLPGFLREHYTTSSDMASLLSAFLISNGANNTRYVGTQPKQGGDAKPDAQPAASSEQLDWQGRRLRPAAPPQEAARPDVEPRQAARPDADGLLPQGPHQGRNAKRLARPGEAPDTAKPADGAQAPAQTAIERGPDGRKSKLSKRGKPGSEEALKPEIAKPDVAKPDVAKTDAPKTDAAKGEPSKGESVSDDKPRGETASQTVKDEGNKSEGTKPSGEGKSEGQSEAAKIDAPKDTGNGSAPALRADPVPPVTPAPPPSPAASSAVSSSSPAPAAPSAPAPPVPPSVTASAPQPVPSAPAGPPIPPISQ
jgi:hypothetical protein